MNARIRFSNKVKYFPMEMQKYHKIKSPEQNHLYLQKYTKSNRPVTVCLSLKATKTKTELSQYQVCLKLHLDHPSPCVRSKTNVHYDICKF